MAQIKSQKKTIEEVLGFYWSEITFSVVLLLICFIQIVEDINNNRKKCIKYENNFERLKDKAFKPKNNRLLPEEYTKMQRVSLNQHFTVHRYNSKIVNTLPKNLPSTVFDLLLLGLQEEKISET